MRFQLLLKSLVSSSVLLISAGAVHANSATSVQGFTTQMGSWNVITTGSFSTDSHVHGKVAVGGNASFSGNAEINSHGNSNAEALRVYGNLKLIGGTKVLSGGATLVKNGSTNTNIALKSGQPNANQSVIVDTTKGASLVFNGNGGNGAPTLNSISAPDNFFTSRDSVLQAANTQLLTAGTFAPSLSNGNKLSFNATTAGVSVFNWNIDQLTSIAEVGFNFSGIDSFIVVNILGSTPSSTWNASFNVLNGSDYLAQHLLWNIGVSTVNLTGDQLLGSILAPDTTINSWKQLNGAIYAGSLNQHCQEIHYTPPAVNVPEEPSSLVLAFAAMALGAAVWVRRLSRASAQ